MRIIGGKFKNKKILLPTDGLTRPLKDLVRESIFNVIEHSNLIENEILNSSILDLYSGSGSFGLECLSRGASRVDFCENYLPAFKILKKNLDHLNCGNDAELFNNNVYNFIDSLNKNKVKYDIIFMDPPYKEKKLPFLLNAINKSKLLSNGGVIIIHRHKKDELKITEKLDIFETRTYGISKIFFGN